MYVCMCIVPESMGEWVLLCVCVCVCVKIDSKEYVGSEDNCESWFSFLPFDSQHPTQAIGLGGGALYPLSPHIHPEYC